MKKELTNTQLNKLMKLALAEGDIKLSMVILEKILSQSPTYFVLMTAWSYLSKENIDDINYEKLYDLIKDTI